MVVMEQTRREDWEGEGGMGCERGRQMGRTNKRERGGEGKGREERLNIKKAREKEITMNRPICYQTTRHLISTQKIIN